MQDGDSAMCAVDTSELWKDGLLCAYEFVPGERQTFKVGGKFGKKSGPVKGKFNAEFTMRNAAPRDAVSSKVSRLGYSSSACDVLSLQEESGTEDAPNEPSVQDRGTAANENAGAQGSWSLDSPLQVTHSQVKEKDRLPHWVPIGWARIFELVQLVQIDAEWISEPREDTDIDDTLSVVDVAAPFFQVPQGPTWWCHVLASHPYVSRWLSNSCWLHPAVSNALRDESRLISDRMKHLYYEVPVRVAGGLLFELLGQSVGDPEEENVPVVLRSWQAQHYLVTAAHVKGQVSKLNVLGVTEVQDLVGAGGAEAPKTAHEVIALLASRLARWDDRLFRKHYFGTADEVELKFVNRTQNEDLAVLTLILNQEIRRLATSVLIFADTAGFMHLQSSVIRVKWSLHAREDIIYELTEHLRGKTTQVILKQTRQNTREMIEEQEAVRGRLFTIQDVMQSTLRAGLQDKSIRIQHNLGVIGGVGLLLSILTGLFGVNLDGIPGNSNASYAFGVYTVCLFLLGAVLILLGMLYLGFKKPIEGDQVLTRSMELQDLVKTFQQAATSHAKVENDVDAPQSHLRGYPIASGLDTQDYLLISEA